MNNATLVEAIEHILPLSPRVRDAFIHVDRGHFIDHHYKQTGQWTRFESPDTSVIYANRSIITQVKNGMPSSSSSQPSIMAAMLEALLLTDGLNVLEIGCGTGYNAGLIAHIVGQQGKVVSIDIDPELVEQTKDHLKRAGIENTVIAHADGFQGYQPEAPYDRIIITAGFWHIPDTWIEQLNPHGILVGNLLGRLSPVLIRLLKQWDGTLEGEVLPQSAAFMSMHQGEVHFPTFPVQEEKQDTLLTMETSTDVAELLRNENFLFFLQYQHRHLERHVQPVGKPPEAVYFRPYLVDTQNGHYLYTDTAGKHIHGHAPLLALFKTWYRDWCTLGQPSLGHYRVARDTQGTLTISLPHRNLNAVLG